MISYSKSIRFIGFSVTIISKPSLAIYVSEYFDSGLLPILPLIPYVTDRLNFYIYIMLMFSSLLLHLLYTSKKRLKKVISINTTIINITERLWQLIHYTLFCLLISIL